MKTLLASLSIYISNIVGFLALLKHPRLFVTLFIRFFSKLYHVDLSEVAKPLEAFESFGDFFLRELKPGSRVIDDGIVSPVDGTLRNFGDIKDNQIYQIKKMQVDLGRLLNSPSDSAEFQDGYFFNLYLSPKDYHHVHMPLSGELQSIDYIPGSLWPVNDFVMTRKENVFAENKRAVFRFSSSTGNFALVMIGALNVGDIITPWDCEVSNQFRTKPLLTTFDSPLPFEKGDRMGSFLLGSSVLFLLDKELAHGYKPIIEAGSIHYGQALTTS